MEGESHLRDGGKVEITSGDDGFRGSYFTGTVLFRASKKDPAKYIVEHDKLTFDAAGTIPLREILSAAFLRPLPPPEADQDFNLGEEVDAYHSDAWWEGVIDEDFGDGRFMVFFRATRERMQFDKADLRLHRKWIAGKWVLPQEDKDEGSVATEAKSNKAMPQKFPVGELVEVSSDEDGFQGAWFSATVVKALKKNKFLIEYKSLRTEDDTEFLREEVDNLHIRPHPPETPVVDKFSLLDEVDALHNDGWWIGAISKVLPGSKYIVYFKNSKEEIKFKHSELRLHQEWIDGNWVVTTKVLKL